MSLDHWSEAVIAVHEYAPGTQGTIEGRRDISSGRSAADRRTAGNISSGLCFTALAYSADGCILFAGAILRSIDWMCQFRCY